MTEPTQHAEFVELLRRHQHQLFSYIFALLRNQQDTEDVFQQASLVWWGKFKEFEVGTNFVGWACKIAQFEVLKFFKRKNRNQAMFGAELQEELAYLAADVEVELSADRLDALGRCISKLADSDRRLLDLAYGEDLKVKQIAEHRRRPVKSVYNSLSRIRQALQECVRRTLAREGD